MGTSEQPGDKDELARAYDAYASEYSRRFADPDEIARRQVGFVMGWGTKLGPGSSVLEIGCADGYVTQHLAGAGLKVAAIDLSPQMIAVAAKRLESVGLSADLTVGDMDGVELEGRFDAVLACMRTFFRYASDPRATLERLVEHVGTKLLIDINPRSASLERALDLVRDVDMEPAIRPLFVPQNYRLGPAGQGLLRVAEVVPIVRGAILRRKFNVVIKGERH